MKFHKMSAKYMPLYVAEFQFKPMLAKEEYERREAAQEAKCKESLSKGWRRQLENPDRLFQGLLVLFTFGLVAVSALQWSTLEKTDETLKAAQQPWIEFAVPTVGDLEWAGDVLIKKAQFGLKNSGHSPALNVRGFSKTLLVWDETVVRKTQEQICHEFNVAAKKEGYGATVFPNNPPLEEFMLFEISKIEIDKFKAGPPIFPRPIAVGCFSYFYGADTSVHNTGFMYLIRPRPASLPFVLPDADEVIPANEQELIPWGSSRIN